jgi:hypothetical protein
MRLVPSMKTFSGIPEVVKPAPVAARGGWSVRGSAKGHLGVEEKFAQAMKAHPVFIVRELSILSLQPEEAGCEMKEGWP